jgi:hypothetical protein
MNALPVVGISVKADFLLCASISTNTCHIIGLQALQALGEGFEDQVEGGIATSTPYNFDMPETAQQPSSSNTQVR